MTPFANRPGLSNTETFEFTTNWFVDNGNVRSWNHALATLKPRRILEIGSWEGQSACYLIGAWGAVHPVEIHCIDTWQGGPEHDTAKMQAIEERFDKNVRLAADRSAQPVSVHKHKSTSAAALVALLGKAIEPFDLVYIDGSHRAADVLVDAVMSFQLLRVGGMMIFDDYVWTMEPQGQEDLLNMPKPAIDAFTSIFARKIRLHPFVPLYQVFLTKLHA